MNSLRARLGVDIEQVPNEAWSFTVASKSRPGVRHRVDVMRMRDGSLDARCECEAATFRPGTECSHAHDVKAHVTQQEFNKMTAQPSSPLQVVPKSGLDRLREPFREDQICKLPKGGAMLDYVGHADVTARLLEVDPEWNWTPMAGDEHGLPLFTRNQDGKPVGLWIALTVCGVTRLGFGSVAPNAFDAEKQLIGDALRNAAMRFGVALDLWSKAEIHNAQYDDAPQSAPARGDAMERAREKLVAAPGTVPDVGSDPETNWKALLGLLPKEGLKRADILPLLDGDFSAGGMATYLLEPAHTLGTLISAAKARKAGN